MEMNLQKMCEKVEASVLTAKAIAIPEQNQIVVSFINRPDVVVNLLTPYQQMMLKKGTLEPTDIDEIINSIMQIANHHMPTKQSAQFTLILTNSNQVEYSSFEKAINAFVSVLQSKGETNAQLVAEGNTHVMATTCRIDSEQQNSLYGLSICVSKFAGKETMPRVGTITAFDDRGNILVKWKDRKQPGVSIIPNVDSFVIHCS